MRLVLCLAVMCFFASGVFAQGEELIFGSTEKTSKDPKYTSKGKHREKRTLILVRTNPRRVLEGNKCFKDYQQTIGIRVSKLEKGEPGNYNDFARFFHNTAVRIRGTIRNGPFWVMRLNRRMRECREQLHDFIG